MDSEFDFSTDHGMDVEITFGVHSGMDSKADSVIEATSNLNLMLKCILEWIL